MPSLSCKCGKKISYGQIPCESEWLFIRDDAFDKIPGIAKADDVYGEMHHALQCADCGRLWMFWKGFGERPTSYMPE